MGPADRTRPVRGHAAKRLLVTAALALGCAPSFDTQRTPAAEGTLGAEVFGVMCERVDWGETPADLTFASGRVPCTRGLGPTESSPGIGPRTTALARMRTDLVGGLDQTFPLALHAPLDRMLVNLLPLYGPDGTGRAGPDAGTFTITLPDGGTAVGEDVLPQLTRATAQQLAAMATDANVLRALGRMSQRQGYRPPETAIGLLRPMLGYDHLDDALDAILGLFREATPSRPEGPAHARFDTMLAVLRGEFQGAGPSTDTRTGTTLDAATGAIFATNHWAPAFADRVAFGNVAGINHQGGGIRVG